jgi:hypothetical protein
MILTYERLREVLHYNPETGSFTWLVKRCKGKIQPGDTAGHVCKTHGYVFIRLDDVLHRAHRLAWLYMTGEWPKDGVDHWDRDRANNRWGNLRPATQAENGQNMKLRRDNKTGHKGVFWEEERQKWRASIVKDQRTHLLGRFESAEEAASAYAAAKASLHQFHPAV